MADEFYREEIIFDVNDDEAIRRVRRAEDRIKKAFDRTKKRAEAFSKVRARPILEVKDRMTRQVKNAERMVSKLSSKKATPIITAKDQVTSVLSKTEKLLEAFAKQDVKVTAELKGDLLRDIRQAQNAVKQIRGLRITPTGRLRGNLLRELKNAERVIKRVGTTKVHPEVSLRDRVTTVLKRVHNGLRKVASKSWEIVIAAKDRTFSVFRRIARGLTSLKAMATIVITVIGLNKLKDFTLGAAMNFEEYEVAMTHWLDGNRKKAQELIEWMGRFADITPFNSDDLFPAFTRAVGISETTDEAKELLKIAADMAALTPGKTVQDAMEALADAQMGEFERMKEFQVKMTQEQYKAIGGWGGFVELVQKRVKGGAQKLSETSIGMISTINGYIKSHFRSLGEGILEALKPRLQTIIDWFDNNQDTIRFWKDTLIEWGREGAETLLQNFEKSAKIVNELFKDPEFQEADFFGKIQIAWDELIAKPFSEWYNTTGKSKIQETSTTIGSNIGAFIGAGLMALFGAGGDGESGNTFVDAGTSAAKAFTKGFADNFDLSEVVKAGIAKLTEINKDALTGEGSVIGAIIADAIVIGLLRKLGVFKLGGWLFGKGKGLFDKIGKATTKTTTVIPDGSLSRMGRRAIKGSVLTRPFKTIGKWFSRGGRGATTATTTTETMSRVARNASRGGLFSRIGRFFRRKGGSSGISAFVPSSMGNAGKTLRNVPYLGTILKALTLASIATSPKEELGGILGGLGGGAAGAKIGGAIGTAIAPGVGTAIGSILGGIIGSLGGEKLGDWFTENFDSIKSKAGEIAEWVGDKFSQAKDTISGTIFNGSWWSEKWNTVKETTSETIFNGSWWLEKAGYVFGYLESTLFSGEWWSEQWNKVRELTAGTIFDGEWWSEKWNSVVEWISSTIFNSEWWFSKWNSVKEWAATTVFSGEWWQEKWQNVLDWTSEKWESAKGIWESVRSTISSTIFSKDWWSEKWNNVLNWGKGILSGIGGWFNENIVQPFKSGREKGRSARRYARGGIITRPHLGLVGEDGPEAIIPLRPGRRNRALELYEKTGRILGVRPYAEGALVGIGGYDYQAPQTSVDNSMNYNNANYSANINLNFDLAGLVGQVIVQNQEDLEDKADEIAGIIATKLKAIFENLT